MSKKRKSCIRPRVSEDEYEVIKKYRAIKEQSNGMGLDDRDVDSGWLKTKEASLHFKNPNYQAPEFNPDKIDWDKITSGVLSEITPKQIADYSEPDKGIFDRLVYTDVHIGMDIPDTAQYGGRWDKRVLMDRLSQMLTLVVKRQKSDLLIVDDLGDFMDGFEGKTARKQHDLPQNMTDQEAFDVGLEFKLKLAVTLLSYYNTVHFHNVCEDNHAGAFGYMVNSAFNSAITKIHKNAIVKNYLKFINHYEVGNNIFILSHGKDSKHLKFGFKPHISDRGVEKINHYIDINYLMRRNARIEFSKGDSHVELIDKAKPSRFEYWNYPAFCPASDWVQANYVPNDSGFYFFNYYATNRYRINPYYF